MNRLLCIPQPLKKLAFRLKRKLPKIDDHSLRNLFRIHSIRNNLRSSILRFSWLVGRFLHRLSNQPKVQMILETAVGLSKEMQDFESESVAEGTDHSQMVKAVLEQSDCGSKGCVYLPDPIAVSRMISSCVILFILPLMGETTMPASKELPFDADLYRRNEQVFSFHADFLYWRIQEGALDYALKMQQSAWGPSQCYAQGHFENATFNGDPGFKIAASFFRAPKYWEIWLQYTRFSSSGTNHSSKPAPDTEFLTGTWPQIFSNPVASASSYIHVNYNLTDLLVSRMFLPNPHLRLRLLGGGTVGWINQFWKVLYQDSGSFETKILNKWNFIGGGLRLGAAFDWYWFTDIYMTGGATFTTLLGSYHNQARQTTNFQPTGSFNSSIPIRNTHYNDVRACYAGQFYLGPSYQLNLTAFRLELFVGYECNAWLNLQEIFRSTNGTPTDAKETLINNGMFALQGLTVRGTFDF